MMRMTDRRCFTAAAAAAISLSSIADALLLIDPLLLLLLLSIRNSELNYYVVDENYDKLIDCIIVDPDRRFRYCCND